MPSIDISTLDPKATVVVATGNAHKVTELEAIPSSRPRLPARRRAFPPSLTTPASSWTRSRASRAS